MTNLTKNKSVTLTLNKDTLESANWRFTLFLWSNYEYEFKDYIIDGISFHNANSNSLDKLRKKENENEKEKELLKSKLINSLSTDAIRDKHPERFNENFTMDGKKI